MEDTESILRRHRLVLAKMQVKTNAGFGRLGERGTVTASKERIPSATGTAAFRIPDMLNASELIEVKNVRRLRLSSQINDFLIFCQATGRTLVLCVRPDVQLSAELALLVASGEIVLRPDLRIFSLKAQEKLKRALMPIIEAALIKGTSNTPGENT